MAPRFVEKYSIVVQLTISLARGTVVSDVGLQRLRVSNLRNCEVGALDLLGRAIVERRELMPTYPRELDLKWRRFRDSNRQDSVTLGHEEIATLITTSVEGREENDRA